MAPGELAKVIQPIRDTFNSQDFPQLLVGLDVADDAGVYQVNDDQAIINTTDFFPPIVDDPYDFGAIAAANALSDVYAMGGKVLFAMNLVAFPADLDTAILGEILRGGAEKVAEAGGVILGGHSVADKEPKYGLAVTGMIHPDKVKRKGGAEAGDVLMLTKPLGVGVITTALKRGKTDQADVDKAVIAMKTLNKAGAEAAQAADAHAMTDITGFGILGHSFEMAKAGNVTFRFDSNAFPLHSGTVRYAEMGTIPGGTLRNADHFAPHVSFGTNVSELMQAILWTPETSGGLLVAVSPDNVAVFKEHMPQSVVVGSVESKAPNGPSIFVD
ncbi:MAG: selenide, water dikinase SelD [Anaerolineae bacterium]